MSDRKPSRAAQLSAQRLAASTSNTTPRPVALTEAQIKQGEFVAQKVAGWFHGINKPREEPSAFAKFFDNIWVDDFTEVPGMGWTGAVASGAQTLYDATNWAASGAMLAANPNYWANRGEQDNLWQTATEVSAGRAFQGLVSPIQDALGEAVTGEAQGVYSSVPGFNIADRQQRESWFSNTPQSIGSGIGDFVVSWYLDPLVVLGKSAKIARYGSELFNAPGITARSTRMGNVVEQVGWEADDAIRYIESGGTAGRETPLSVIGETIAKGNYSELREITPFKTSDYKDTLASVGQFIEDPVEAIMFTAAASGNVRYQRLLRDRAAAIHDAMVRATSADEWEKAWLNGFHGEYPVLGDVLEMNVNGAALVEDLIKRDKALQDAVGLLDVADAPIRNIGGTSVTGMKIAAAWKAGKASRDIRYQARKAGEVTGDEATTWTQRIPSGLAADIDAGVAQGKFSEELGSSMKAALAALDKGDEATFWKGLPTSAPGVYEKVYQLSSDFRRVRVWSWINKQRGSGWIAVRGLDDGYASDELVAAATDSAVVKKDAGFLRSIMDEFAQARGAQDRWGAVQNIETRITRRIAAEYGVPEDVALAVYKYVDARRARLIKEFTSRKGRAFAFDPESGDPIVLDPQLVSQLETKVPMMDFRLLDSTIKRLSKDWNKHLWEDIREGANDIGFSTLKSHGLMVLADELNAAWKAAVLMRLGYTQRNVAEGWMRTWAVLGSIPALAPKNAVRGMYRLAWGNPRAAAMQRSYTAIEKNLASVIEEQRTVLKALDDDLAEWNDYVSRGGLNATRGTADWFNRPAYMQARRARDEAQQALDDMLYSMEQIAAKRRVSRKRYIGDESAFAGELGELRRALASNEQTQRNFFDTRYMRDVQALDQNRWVAVRPDDPQYWDELSSSVEQFRNDPLAAMALRGATVDEMAAWLSSQAARPYRQSMRIKRDGQAADHVAKVHDMVNGYLPTPEARALAASDNVPSGSELKALLGGTEGLQPIHGRAVGDALKFTQDPYHGFLEFMFKWLGNKPESALVRQPFYAEVYQRETAALFKMARKQGYDDLDDAAQKAWDQRIMDTAHRRSLKATNDTLFTIIRYSNPAAVMRFVSPFFAAWENSMRVWLGIIVRDPSVAARASLLWDLPNRLGLVVDKDGNPVESDRFGFLTGSENQYVILPKPVNDFFMGINGGLPVKAPKGAFNVVSPGESPFFPGFGPAVTAPAAFILKGKPDTQAWLRKQLGDKVYNQLAPFGNVASGSAMDVIADTVLPAAARKGMQFAQGENSADYLAVVGAITQQEMVDWYKAGGEESGIPKPTPKQMKEKADAFYKFSALASLVSPVSITRMSKYQDQIDFWNSIKAKPYMTWQEKIATFNRKYGDAFMPLTRSTSRSQVEGLDPTIETFNVMMEHSDKVEMLANLDPRMVSVLASTATDGEFDSGVYNYWLNTDMPGTPGDTYKKRADSGDVINDAVISEMDREYYAEKAKLKVALDALGVSTVTSKAAQDAGVTDLWNQFEDRMLDKYGEAWTAFGPQYFEKNAGVTMTAVAVLANDEDFMKSELGQSPVWRQIGNYMDLRRQAREAIDAGAPKEEVEALWAQDVAKMRYSSLSFADFYDRFLQYDDLTIEVPND